MNSRRLTVKYLFIECIDNIKEIYLLSITSPITETIVLPGFDLAIPT
ncbi:MAG: hypothetical protein OEZ20_05680 [candidate division WOR-3 bacterium]|nr:hypothetical protein [candidate division WOR-3 bacterium]